MRYKLIIQLLIITIYDNMRCDSYKRVPYCPKDGFIACEDGYMWRSKSDYLGCYRAEYKCDGIVDCSDGSDEKYCPLDYNYGKLGFSYRFVKGDCPDNHYMCKNGYLNVKDGYTKKKRCIHENQICDGEVQCKDESDETYCPYNLTTGFNFIFQRNDCPPDQLRCKSFSSGRKCIRRSWICDDVTDCDDASDEILCPHIFENDSSSQYDQRSTTPPRTSTDSFRISPSEPTWITNTYQPIQISCLTKINFVISSITGVTLIALMYNLYRKIKVQYFQSMKYYTNYPPELSTAQ